MLSFILKNIIAFEVNSKSIIFTLEGSFLCIKKKKLLICGLKCGFIKKDLGMENIFSQNIKYIESYGVKYENLLEVKRWFHEWNKKNNGIIMGDKRFLALKINKTMVVWSFLSVFFEGKS